MTTEKTIRCGKCHGTHASVAAVRECHQGAAANPFVDGPDAETFEAQRRAVVTSGRMATERQASYLASLLVELGSLRDGAGGSWTAWYEQAEKLTLEAASSAIEESKAELGALKARAKGHDVTADDAASGGRSNDGLEDGTYQRPNGEVVVAYHTQQGFPVAKVLHVECVEGVYSGEFIYGGMAARRGLTPAMRLSQEEAQALGIKYSFCVRCARSLSLGQSQYVGYGETCAEHEGWWYPTAAELRKLLESSEDPRKVGAS